MRAGVQLWNTKTERDPVNRMTRYVVNYVYKANFDGDDNADRRQKIRDDMDILESQTCLKFLENPSRYTSAIDLTDQGYLHLSYNPVLNKCSVRNYDEADDLRAK